ncbi:hypothetical protein ABL78_4164 [Leptomonas seymouri]|uniref:Uncharacterized protein n=1 Tax=Leptomonas seymouri TaxID=5684 RepID=A0A0N0P649_LEPSE|nr:hypothetical protein ABL78_4164 [Leptomonas seymouri]|eukprot:KPI86747.1 hypothetical protein ABL78_4164 [Leptomonas seymouri]
MMDQPYKPSSPLSPGQPLSTIVRPVSNTRTSVHHSRPSSNTSVNETISGHQHPPPQLSEERGSNALLGNERAGETNVTSSSWDGAGTNSTLTFSLVSPGTGRHHLLVESDKIVAFNDTESVLLKENSSQLLAKGSPRRRGEPFVKIAAISNGSSAAELRHNGDVERRSVSWHPQGLFGAALERFQAREGTPNFSTAMSSMGGMMLENDVSGELSPEASASPRRRLSVSSVHAIQFDTDFRSNVTPFMSISSLGISRQSTSGPRVSLPPLSIGSVQMSVGSVEGDPLTQDVAVSPITETRPTTSPEFSIPSPENSETVPDAHVERQHSTRSHRIIFYPMGSDEVQPPPPPVSPSTATRFSCAAQCSHKPNASVGSHMTMNTTAPVREDGETSPESRDFLMDAECEVPALNSTIFPASIPANSTTDMFACSLNPEAQLLSLGEPRIRTKKECVEAVEVKKLRSLEGSESRVLSRKGNSVPLRATARPEDTIKRHLVSEEHEQLLNSMRARMRAAEAEHQQSMRELREREHSQPTLKPHSLISSDIERALAVITPSKRRVSDTAAGSPRKNTSVHFSAASLPSTTPPLPPLESSLLSTEVRLAMPHPPSNTIKNVDGVGESRSRCEQKLRASLENGTWKHDGDFQRLGGA